MGICTGKDNDLPVIWTDGTGAAACGRTDAHRPHAYQGATGPRTMTTYRVSVTVDKVFWIEKDGEPEYESATETHGTILASVATAKEADDLLGAVVDDWINMDHEKEYLWQEDCVESCKLRPCKHDWPAEAPR